MSLCSNDSIQAERSNQRDNNRRLAKSTCHYFMLRISCADKIKAKSFYSISPIKQLKALFHYIFFEDNSLLRSRRDLLLDAQWAAQLHGLVSLHVTLVDRSRATCFANTLFLRVSPNTTELILCIVSQSQ